MKIQAKFLTIVLASLTYLGIVTFVLASMKINEGVTKQAYAGMEATTTAVRELYFQSIDEEGNMDEQVVQDTFDNIKKQTAYDVTLFIGDTRAITTIVDGSGKRVVGTKASDAVIEQVLNKGENYQNDNTEILGTRYICYYIPVKDDAGKNVGMVFLGEEYDAMNSIIRRTQGTLLSVIIGVLLFSAAIAAIAGRNIAVAIRKACSYLSDLSGGKLSIDMSSKMLSRRDEIGEICSSVNELSGYLNDVVSEIKNESQLLMDTSESCNQSARQAHDMAEQIDIAVSQIATSATAQAENAEEAGNSVDIIGKVIENTNSNMDMVAAAADNMSDTSVSVRQILGQLNASMVQVKEAVVQIQKQTEETNNSVMNIGEKANVITDVANQTNLLSLNASIEAARAGDAGRGFAVVATEIQKLAEQCSTSAIEIRETLAQLTDDSQKSVETMSLVSNMIIKQEECLSQTNQAFDTMEDGIKQSVDGIKMIEKEIVELTKAKENTVDVVQTVAAIAEENAASTEEASATVEQVTEAIATVAEQMSGLKDIAAILQQKTAVFH